MLHRTGTNPDSRPRFSAQWVLWCVAVPAGSGVAELSSQGLRKFPEGMSAPIEASINRGLAYLARSQNRNGSWGEGTGYSNYVVAMTSLAGMALLGSGSSATRGAYWSPVRKAVRFLLDCAKPDGLIVAPGEGRPMYGHGFATLFLSQVYGMELDPRMQKKLHRVLTRAITLTCRAQCRAGGWYYDADSRREEGSVTITQVQGLRACRNAGIVVPKKTIDAAVRYIARLANSDGGISYSLGRRGSRAPITAAAVAVLYNAGKYDDPMAAKALDYSVRHLPTNGSGNYHHFYAQLYLAQALFQEGKPRWRTYYDKMSRWLMRQQGKDGSWQGDRVGQIYGTAVATTILQLPRGLVPIYQR